jgi:hypothetical protein
MKIKISKNQWKFIGKKAGWIKKAQEDFDGGNEYNTPESDWDDLGELGKQESFEHSISERESDITPKLTEEEKEIEINIVNTLGIGFSLQKNPDGSYYINPPTEGMKSVEVDNIDELRSFYG